MTTITTKSKNEKVQLHMTPLRVGKVNLAAKFSQQKTHLGKWHDSLASVADTTTL